jgi:hypothetical protein
MLGAGITEIGGEVRTLTLDEPSAGAAEEVVIDVRAAGVGNWDELARVGSWRIGGPPPMALGVEAAGTIADSTPADLLADSSDRRVLAQGMLTLEVAAVHPLEAAAKALADAASGHMSGAVVISPAS